MTKTDIVWYRLSWPREVEAAALDALSRLLASSASVPVVVEAIGTAGMVTHRLGVLARRGATLAEQLRSALPGLLIEELDGRAPIDAQLVLELRLSTRLRPLAIDNTQVASRALLTALASPTRGEQLVLQWLLVSTLRPASVGNQHSHEHESWGSAFLASLSGPSKQLDADARGALRSKRGLPMWRAIGRIAVHAQTQPRQRQLVGHVLDALRLVEAPGVHFKIRRAAASSIDVVKKPCRVQLRLNSGELVAVAAWPLGATSNQPIRRTGSRPLPPSRALARRGRVIGQASFPGREQPVALSVSDSLRHLHVLGPTGVGKSTLLLNLIEQDIKAGRSVVVIEPKGDLISDVLDRIPESRIDDVVLLDPTDPAAVVGLNPLNPHGRSPELVADQLLSTFIQLYPGWAPRTNDLLGSALATLARTPGSTLVHLPLLLSDASFRRRVVGGLNEPIVLEPAWAQFESWSEAERTAAVAPSLTRIRPFLARSDLRAVLGQPEPRFDMRQVFTERKILLVNLAKGQMGAEAAALLGSLAVAQLWQTALQRSAIAPERRQPVFVFIDEFQDYLHLPTDLGEALTQARGLAVGLTLAHQHLNQLSPQVRSALANARSRVCFQLAADDARVVAAGASTPNADDFMSLGAFEVYSQLVADGAVQPWASVRTFPASPGSSKEQAVRARSRERYGVSRQTVDEAIRKLVSDRRSELRDDIGAQPRGSGGAS